VLGVVNLEIDASASFVQVNATDPVASGVAGVSGIAGTAVATLTSPMVSAQRHVMQTVGSCLAQALGQTHQVETGGHRAPYWVNRFNRIFPSGFGPHR
jgi:hypothetical protein